LVRAYAAGETAVALAARYGRCAATVRTLLKNEIVLPRIAREVGEGQHDDRKSRGLGGAFTATLAARFALMNHHAPPAITTMSAASAAASPVQSVRLINLNLGRDAPHAERRNKTSFSVSPILDARSRPMRTGFTQS
jgi:hypothetical protein